MNGRPAPAPQPYYCGWCAGHGVRPCDYCVLGEAPDGGRCSVCRNREGLVQCPDCSGSPMLVRPPDWVTVRVAKKTPRPPRLSSRGILER